MKCRNVNMTTSAVQLASDVADEPYFENLNTNTGVITLYMHNTPIQVAQIAKGTRIRINQLAQLDEIDAKSGTKDDILAITY